MNNELNMEEGMELIYIPLIKELATRGGLAELVMVMVKWFSRKSMGSHRNLGRGMNE